MPSETSRTTSGKPGVVLLEHERPTGELVKEALSSIFEVSWYTKVQGAFNSVLRDRPAVVVTDLYLISDGLSGGIELGLKFVQDLRSAVAPTEVPIAILSKYGNYIHPLTSDDLVRYRAEGMQYGPSKRYPWLQLEAFRKELQELGVGDTLIFNKFKYADKDYRSFPQDLEDALKREAESHGDARAQDKNHPVP